ncbi:hypothetical protein F0562_014871 [Nyssa sinensis]|uniref:Ripening-related protein 1 n=1 Tax=Nyssa sinensis TaxID=561372 RepID=A0A5J4ZPL7_9ASTE|nr:hypothetical protein F0562_014871 [Nyssa sinensis]
MMKLACSRTVSLLIFFLLLVSIFSIAEAQSCKPSGKLKGKKPPPRACNTENNSDCCEAGKFYDVYKCSPKVTGHTKAVLTINSFENGGDGGGPSECDNKYHSDDTPVVALSTGWFNNKKRCLNFITIHGNGKSVKAKVVDECDSTMGCDAAHDYQPPCDNNIVDASKAVWKALGVPEKDWVLTINSFEEGGDGGGSSECDNKFHSDSTPVVALSTGWFNKKKRCLNFIHGNGKSVKAKVVDECEIKIMIFSLHAITTFLMPPKLFGRP